MSQTIQVKYNLAGNFTFDATKITLGSGSAALVSKINPVVWINLVNTTAVGSTLTKTSGTNGAWDAQGISQQQIASGFGFVSFQAPTSDTAMCGLSHRITPVDFTSIDFAIYAAGGNLAVYESGNSQGTFGTYASTDVLTVQVNAGVVTYQKNGTTFFTSSATPTFPLQANASFYSTNSNFNNVNFGTSPTKYDLSNPSITMTPATGFNASSLSNFLETSIVTAPDAIQYVLLANNIPYYWNGSAWVVSNGMYAQSNPASTIVANIAAFAQISLGALIQLTAFLHSNTGAGTPILTEDDITYAPFFPPGVQPNVCACFLRIEDLLGFIPAQASLTLTPAQAFISHNRVILNAPIFLNFDVNGYAQAGVFETTTVNQQIAPQLNYTESNGFVGQVNFAPILIPNATSLDLSTVLVPQ